MGHLFVHIRKICRWPGLKQYHSLVSNLRFEQQLRLEKWYRQLGRHRQILGEDICFSDMNLSEFLKNSSSIILSSSICAENESRLESLVCDYRISSYSFRRNYSFLNFEIVANSNSSVFLLNKLNFCCGNYSREETIQGRKLYEEIRYTKISRPWSDLIRRTGIFLGGFSVDF